MKLHIADMLRAQKKHISFHTPGHKRAGADITELSYSDNLYCPTGVIARAEADIAAILGAHASFLSTDGSTAGVFAMLYAAKIMGARRVALPARSHPSAFHAMAAMELSPVVIPQGTAYGIPLQPAEEAIAEAAAQADALFLTSPDYYGFFPPLIKAREIASRLDIPLLVDGAHGAHLHFTERYAGRYADLWVDGAHKSLPAMTQGAVVSANAKWSGALSEGVRVFRTTSPSYPILASVEYAIKYPRSPRIEARAEAFKREYGCVLNEDWSKLLVPFGATADGAQRALEARGVYPEFNDGNYLMFYLSPCTREREISALGRELKRLVRGEVDRDAPAGGIPIYREGI